MPKDEVKVLVRIDRTLSGMLINMFPDDYKSFATETGELVVELDRAMYGCVEAETLVRHDTEQAPRHGIHAE